MYISVATKLCQTVVFEEIVLIQSFRREHIQQCSVVLDNLLCVQVTSHDAMRLETLGKCTVNSLPIKSNVLLLHRKPLHFK